MVAFAAGLVVLGFIQVNNSRKDLLPEFSPTTVEVQTEALGLSAYEVEQFITVPLEQDLLNGVAFLQEIESASLPGLSSVVMTFEPGTDILDARQVVTERLTQAVTVAGLPNVADSPQMIQPLSSTSRVALVSLFSDELSQIQQSVLARWLIVPRLLGVDGVANVAIWGFRDRQLQVLVDPQRLAEEGLTLNDVIRTSGNALEVSPLSFLEASTPGTGGFIDTANQRLHVFHKQTISTPDELAQVPIEDSEGSAVLRNGQPLLLGAVTDIIEDHQPLIGDARCNERPCLLLVIEKFPDANTPSVARGVEEALRALEPGLPGLVIDTSIYSPADFIESGFRSLGVVLAIGAILMIAVVWVLAADWRMTVVVVTTVAASLGAAGLVLALFSVTLNTMILAGVAMALVAIVADAVSAVTTIARRAGHDRIEGDGGSPARTIMAAAAEMGRPAVYATSIVVAALIPFFVMRGEVGAFFPRIATAYLVAVAVALLLSVTVAPALILLLLRNTEGTVLAAETKAASRIRIYYQTRPQRDRARVTPALATFGALVIAALVAIPFLDTALRPALQERDLVVSLDAPPGISLPRMDEINSEVVRDIQALPGVNNLAAHVGRAVMSDQVVNVNAGQVWVSIDESADYRGTISAIEGILDKYPDLASDVSTYSDKRVTEVLGRSADELIVRVYGEDDQVLATTAAEIGDLVASVPGVEGTRLMTELEEEAIEITVDIEKAQAFGLKPGDVRRTAATLLAGITVGNLFEEQKVFDVVVWGSPEIRHTSHDIGGLLIATPMGTHVPLSEVADVRIITAPTVIKHESVSKYLDVDIAVDKDNLGAVAEAVESRLQDYRPPTEFHVRLLGGLSEQEAARGTVLAVSMAALIGVYLLLQSAFTSWRLATLAIVLLPLAATGSILATLVTTRRITLGVIAGLIAVFGLGTRWVISLVGRYQDLERGGEPFGVGVVKAGTTDRLTAIVASGVAIIAFFLPAAIRSQAAGLELVGPLAVAVLGGVITTMVLALVVLPAVYLRWGHVKRPDLSAQSLIAEHELEEEPV